MDSQSETHIWLIMGFLSNMYILDLDMYVYINIITFISQCLYHVLSHIIMWPHDKLYCRPNVIVWA